MKEENRKFKYRYTENEYNLIEKHIENHFGYADRILKDENNDYLNLEIFIIPPTIDKPHYTLVTVGMGSYEMNIDSDDLKRCEFVICLPASWDIENDEKGRWPFVILKTLLKIPFKHNSWLGWGHTVNYENSFADNTDFSGIIIYELPFEKEAQKCMISDSDIVNFYQIYPLYDIEMQYSYDHGSRALREKFGENINPIVDIDRSPVVSEDYKNIIDSVEDHSKKIEEKNLDLPYICGANHIAAYLMWIIKHKMINKEFMDFFKQEIQEILNGTYDVRKFIINSLGGEFTKEILNDKGRSFTEYYYNFYPDDDDPSYPNDVDMVGNYYCLIKNGYPSDEFKDEEYLFVPYDDYYFKSINKFINKAYREYCKKTD